MRATTERRQSDQRSACDMCRECALDLEEAISQIERWGAPIGEASRVRNAVKVLRDTESLAQFPVAETDRARVVNAMYLANDFADIAKNLPSTHVNATAKTLADAFGGSLEQREAVRRPYQAQSELWIGSVLARGGLSPLAIPRQKASKTPDYQVTIGTINYSVEVKRPEKEATAADRLSDGAGQLLEFGRWGAVALDLADALRYVAPDEVERCHERVQADLVGQIWRGNELGYQAGYEGVMVLVTAGRTIQLLGATKPYVNLYTISGTACYEGRPKTLTAIHAGRLADAINEGFATAGFTGAERATGWDRELRLVSRDVQRL